MPAFAAVTEAQVKAAYLYRLASFVRWPPQAFADGSAPLRLCVAGRNDIFVILQQLARGQQAAGRPLAAELVDVKASAPMHCQLLFIGRATGAGTSLPDELQNRPILTVTDRGAGIRGGVIEFVMVGGTVRFLIHRQAAEARQIALSSKLLAVGLAGEP